MTTTTIITRTAEQYLENDGLNKVAQAVGRVRENAADFLGRIGRSLWTVSLDLQLLRASFSLPHETVNGRSTHVWPSEQASINSILMGQ